LFFKTLVTASSVELQEMFFTYHAISIQRLFRGFYSRKYVHNYLKRHEYIESVRKKGEEVREMMKVYREELEQVEAEQAREQQTREFRSLTSRLHHLVSTSTTPGVFSSPMYGDSDLSKDIKSMTMSRTVKGVSIEDHLEEAMRETLKEERKEGAGLAPDLTGHRKKIPLTLPSSRLSLQASSPYELPELEERRQRRLVKLKLRGHASMLVGKPRKAITLQVEPMSEPYLDPWDNPYMKRGIPKSQKELTMGRTSFEKAPDIPFHTSVGGNKSSVLPNDRFDVILEAEQSGGVTQRQQGKGSRFGLADTCDQPRLPAPP
jgi:hypothetical protein